MQHFTFKAADDGTFCAVSYEGNEPHVTVPDTYCGMPVTVIYDRLFKGHTEITSVKLPDSITDIGAGAFDGCTGLKELTLPRELRNMWQYAFVRSSIEHLELPEKVEYIVPFTFQDCKQLKSLVCPKGLKRIGSWAFRGCDALTELTVSPETEISPKARD